MDNDETLKVDEETAEPEIDIEGEEGLDALHTAEQRAEYLANREYERILNEILLAKRVHADWKDVSRNPSYSKFQIPLHIKCRDRYINTKKLYESQFQREIAEMLNQQSSAYEAARFQRHIAISTLWPPLHNRHEIEYVQRNFFQLTPKQKKRYNYIMSTKII